MAHCACGNSRSFSIRFKLAPFFQVQLSDCYLSDYPAKRSVKGKDGEMEGVAGTLELLNEIGAADQPITSFSWNADHLGLGACTSFDQTVRIIAATRLNCL